MHLTTVGRAIWQGAKEARRLAEAGAGDPEAGKRLPRLRLVKALRESKRGWDEIEELLGISRATYYRWERALREGGLAGLKPKSRRPRRLRGKVHWRPELLLRVEELRFIWGRGPKEEFYTRALPTRVAELQAELKAYLDYYNRRRPHMALSGLAALEFLAKIQEGSVPQGVSNVVANYMLLTQKRELCRIRLGGKYEGESLDFPPVGAGFWLWDGRG
nr:helix-turn-helix domain-containing protein [Thermus albus]